MSTPVRGRRPKLTLDTNVSPPQSPPQEITLAAAPTRTRARTVGNSDRDVATLCAAVEMIQLKIARLEREVAEMQQEQALLQQHSSKNAAKEKDEDEFELLEFPAYKSAERRVAEKPLSGEKVEKKAEKKAEQEAEKKTEKKVGNWLHEN